MTDKVKNNPYALIEQIENMPKEEFYRPEEFNSWINALASLGEAAVKALLEKMPMLLNSRLHYVGAHVFSRVGHPVNSTALEFMVSDVSNPNSSSYEVSRDALLKIGAPAVPVIDEALEFYKRDCENNALEIDSLEDLRKHIQR